MVVALFGEVPHDVIIPRVGAEHLLHALAGQPIAHLNVFNVADGVHQLHQGALELVALAQQPGESEAESQMGTSVRSAPLLLSCDQFLRCGVVVCYGLQSLGELRLVEPGFGIAECGAGAVVQRARLAHLGTSGGDFGQEIVDLLLGQHCLDLLRVLGV